MSSGALLAERWSSIGEWQDEDEAIGSAESNVTSIALLHERRKRDADVRAETEDARAQFELLADELAEATAALSSTRRATQHPAYAELIALGPAAIPFLLERVKRSENPAVWLRLLGSLTSYQPGAGMDTIDEAVAAWHRWAKYGGHLV